MVYPSWRFFSFYRNLYLLISPQITHSSQPNIPFLDLVDFLKNLISSVSDDVNEENTQKLEQNSVHLLNERINRNITQNEISKCIKILLGLNLSPLFL
jgi:hypothetical protein